MAMIFGIIVGLLIMFLSTGIAYAQEDCGCDSVCEEVLKPKYVRKFDTLKSEKS